MAAWIADAKARMRQAETGGASLWYGLMERDLRTALTMLVIALAALDHIAANGQRNSRGLDAQEALDALDALARGEP